MDIDWVSGAAPESDWRDGIRIKDDVVVFRLSGGGIEFDPELGKGPMERSESWSMEGGWFCSIMNSTGVLVHESREYVCLLVLRRFAGESMSSRLSILSLSGAEARRSDDG